MSFLKQTLETLRWAVGVYGQVRASFLIVHRDGNYESLFEQLWITAFIEHAKEVEIPKPNQSAAGSYIFYQVYTDKCS